MPAKPDSSAVHARMLQACYSSARAGSSIVKAIEHHLCAGGNRVRATFSLEASRRLGIGTADAITLAAICELLHNASLVHDDLLDRASIRRGEASVWAQFGDSAAVCAGDLLLATAFSLVAEIDRVAYLPKVLSLVHQRTRDVILGQDAEQAWEADDLEAYERIAIGKSAALLSLPLELSLLLSGHEQSLVKAQHAAESFAVAYQMLDDLNDYDEDRRNGSVNAVWVTMRAGDLDQASANDLVRQRAETLIRNAMEAAACLPMESGSAMVAYAQKMRHALAAFPGTATHQMELLRHGR